jgi:ferritin-like metal-binding protein YciE
MKITSIKELFLDTLNSIFDIEQQLTVALPRMAEASSTPELRQAFEQHLNETREHVDRAQQIFKQIGERPGRKPNLVLEGMTQGVEELIGNLDEGRFEMPR